MDKQLRDIATTIQLQDLVRKQKEAQQVKDVLASAAKPTFSQEVVPEGQTLRDDQGVLTMGAQPRQVTGMEYDMKKVIPTLQALGRFDLIKDIAQSQQELRKSGNLSGDMEQSPSPFASYLTATNPEVRTLAKQLEAGFRKGIIDEETAYKRIEPLARMEQQYIERADKKAEGAKPTESQYKAATLGGRLEKALQDLTLVNQTNPAALKPEFFPELLQGSVLSYVPGAGMLAGKISSEDRLRAEAAQLDALDAALTLGTGAAYTKEQLRGYAKSYFPQVGDTEKVIMEKNARFAHPGIYFAHQPLSQFGQCHLFL